MRKEYLADELQENFFSGSSLTEEGKTRLDINVSMLEETFKQNCPYQKQSSIIGDKFIWTNAFVYKLLWAFATDRLGDMGESERKLYDDLVYFEETTSYSYTNSAPNPLVVTNRGLQLVNNGKVIGYSAIGCTLQDEHGKSYMIHLGTEVLGEECVRLNTEVYNQDVMESLDQLLVDMVNDVPNNRDKLPTGELVDVTNSALDNIKDIEDGTNT